MDQAFNEHLKSGLTSVCRAWSVIRRDGQVFGFTDHDCELSFDGVSFKADSGLSAMAVQQSTGLSIDNTEAMGALSDAAIREEDIEAGRFDGAEVRAWLVNWRDVAERHLLFRGTIGDLTRSGESFQAELRGLTDVLNRPIGRVYQKPCPAVLGDGNCQFDLSTPGYSVERAIEIIEDGQNLIFQDLSGFAEGWFERGRLSVVSGQAADLFGLIKRDQTQGGQRVIELWQPMRAPLVTGDQVRLEAGCDKRFTTCGLKFDNALNFQGFPDLPGDDWMVASPAGGAAAGGSRR